MTWNYRILAIEHGLENMPKEIYLEIRSVYYEEGKPVSYADRGHALGGSTFEEVYGELRLQELALKLPILWGIEGKFPEEYTPA